jgi:sulfoxide reductase catalytic subunit YedY
MSKKRPVLPDLSQEITPKALYLSRRDFIRTAEALGLAAALTACIPAARTTSPTPTGLYASSQTDELGNALTSYTDITNYNNYYEFSIDKQAVAGKARNFPTSPWSITVSGLVQNPTTFSITDLATLFPPEERIYRMRCVETWSMVIPWVGFPLWKLLDYVQPGAAARYVHFTGLFDQTLMPGQNDLGYPWPYSEGLRMDEARHDLTILTTGLYGEPLPSQDGGPIRLVVPWKYGFKSIKAIVKIELVDKQPQTFWSLISPNEYGFYANVNPKVSHPRWSQATERRIGESQRRPTLMFNGYADQVASLYEGMDLSVNY